MKCLTRLAAAAFLLLSPHAWAAPATSAAPAPLTLPDIAYTKFTLSNGLTVVVHEDHKAPIVAVNLWYHVGSKDEPPGRTGFAHLFEHLMFGATGGNQRGWFERLEAVGATGVNGTTETDRTNFFETVPTPALDMALAMEAGRMGHLLDNFSEALLNTQRGVVQNEKRQDENQPYAVFDELSTKSVWPQGHPYSHTVIGEMTDLDAAKTADVKDWFGKYYGPTNAVLVLSGDITADDARAKVEKYFGAIPPGPPVARQKVWIAKRAGEQRATVQDHVPQARVYLVWNTPPRGTADNDYLDLLGDVLTVGKDSRLYRRLVYQDRIATEVEAGVDEREIASLFQVDLTAKPGVPLSQLEAACQEELDRLLRDGPTAAELSRYKTRKIADFVRRAERVGGFGGTSDVLAASQTYFGDPGAWKISFEHINAATPQDVAAAGRRWLSDGAFTLEITPFPAYTPSAGPGAAAAIPAPGPALAPHFPTVRGATLSNGLKVVVAERHAVPEVVFDLLVDAGDASDPPGEAGLQTLATRTMLYGTKTLDALAFDDLKIGLGVSLGASSDRDSTQVYLSAVTSRLDPSLDLFADLILHPAFRAADIDRERDLQIAEIRQARQAPIGAAIRIAPTLVYGSSHPYGRLVTEETLAKITAADLERQHQLVFQPRNATLIIVGDTTLEAILPKLEARLGAWRSSGAASATTVPTVAPPAAPVVYLIDKPGALQSVIAAGIVAPPKADPDDLAIRAATTTLGGAFTSRLNLNLREDKHWAYGAFAIDLEARGPGLFAVLAPVQTDKTKESFSEVRRELTEVISSRPITPSELDQAKHNLTLSLPGRWETNQSVAGSLADIAKFGLAQDYFVTYPARVDALTQADVERAVTRVVRPDALTWVIVGDKAKVEAPLESLGLKIIPITADGAPAG